MVPYGFWTTTKNLMTMNIILYSVVYTAVDWSSCSGDACGEHAWWSTPEETRYYQGERTTRVGAEGQAPRGIASNGRGFPATAWCCEKVNFWRWFLAQFSIQVGEFRIIASQLLLFLYVFILFLLFEWFTLSCVFLFKWIYLHISSINGFGSGLWWWLGVDGCLRFKNLGIYIWHICNVASINCKKL